MIFVSMQSTGGVHDKDGWKPSGLPASQVWYYCGSAGWGGTPSKPLGYADRRAGAYIQAEPPR